jgi:DNA polymerase III sliding clamp (beta) subunit (PCNA family)
MKKIEKKIAKKKEAPRAAKAVDKSVVKFDSKVAQAVAQAGAAVPAKTDVKDPKVVMTHATTGAVVSGPKAEAKKDPAGTVIIPRETFEKDLAVANDFIERKATLPVLACLLLAADGKGNVTMTATNLEQHWSKIAAAKGDAISRCVPAALLLKEVKALPPDTANVELAFKENGEVRVNGRCTIYTHHADEFPKWEAPKKMTELSIDNFVPGLQKVAHAMGENDARFVLNGALLDIKKSLVVATDGHRLAYDGIGIRGEQVDNIIIPRRAVLLMVKYPESVTPRLVRDAKVTLAQDSLLVGHAYDLDIFGHKVHVKYTPQLVKEKLFLAGLEWRGPVNETAYFSQQVPAAQLEKDVKAAGSLKGWLQLRAEEQYMVLKKTVAISVCPTMLSWPCAGGVMMTKIIDGSFPNYQGIIPKESPIKVKFNAQAFLQTIEGVLPLSNETTRCVRLRVNGKLEISSEQPDRGTFKWSIPCETTGKKADLLIGFNIRYLVDAIKAFSGTDIMLELTDALGPARVNTKAVVMPMRA